MVFSIVIAKSIGHISFLIDNHSNGYLVFLVVSIINHNLSGQKTSPYDWVKIVRKQPVVHEKPIT